MFLKRIYSDVNGWSIVACDKKSLGYIHVYNKKKKFLYKEMIILHQNVLIYGFDYVQHVKKIQ